MYNIPYFEMILLFINSNFNFMKKLVKPIENLSSEEKSVVTLCGENICIANNTCGMISGSSDSETENDIIF